MKIKYLIFAISLLQMVFFSCSQNEEKKLNPSDRNRIQTGDNRRIEDSLWREALNNGDFRAYNEISNDYLLKLKDVELYYYALIMANKYNCPEAYAHLYMILTKMPSYGGIEMVSKDNTTRSQAIFYLLKANELGHQNSKSDLFEIFHDSISPPKSDIYLRKIEDSYRK